MTTKIIAKEEIRAQILKVLSGYCFRERKTQYPTVCILSPWISDVELEIDLDVYALDDIWFGLDYGIKSINLAYALLLLRLDFGAKIEIVTLPPNEQNYGNGAFYHQQLLEFLDEIGCSVYLNTSLHSKLILSNDSALLGSFNLSKSALYNREEVGVSIDDISNLKILDDYVRDIIFSSEPYGYTAKTSHKLHFNREESFPSRITRGILYERLVEAYYGRSQINETEYGEFLREGIGLEGIYSKYIIYEIASELDRFYIKALLAYIQPSTRYFPNQDSDDKKLERLRVLFDYEGGFDVEEITKFVKAKFVRKYLPKIKLKMERMPKVKGEVTPKWAAGLT